MLHMIKGCRIKDPGLLYEGYERIENGFAANVDADKLLALLESFVLLHHDFCFVILEVPANIKDEAVTDRMQTFHKDVYYLDGLTPERMVDFLRVFGEWLIHDGLSSFGIGIHSGENEIILGKYNAVTVYTKTPGRYDGFFEAHGIHEVCDIKTAWDFFTSDAPGESFLYEHNGKNIYDLVEHLKQYGLYFAERREA